SQSADYSQAFLRQSSGKMLCCVFTVLPGPPGSYNGYAVGSECFAVAVEPQHNGRIINFAQHRGIFLIPVSHNPGSHTLSFSQDTIYLPPLVKSGDIFSRFRADAVNSLQLRAVQPENILWMIYMLQQQANALRAQLRYQMQGYKLSNRPVRYPL